MPDAALTGGIGLRVQGFKADFGYVLGRSYWGNGNATEALCAIGPWALDQPSVHRVWGVCDVDNTASARVMAKSGLQCEGVLRRWIMQPQLSAALRDRLCYSMVR